MQEFIGLLRLPDERPGSGLSVRVDVDEERLVLYAGEERLGEWRLDDIGVHADDEGFHLRLEGEDVALTTNDDGSFALALGLAAASPRLRRLMGAALRGESRQAG